MLSVPTTIGSTPKVGGVNVGPQSVPKRKSPGETSPKNWIEGTISEMTIAVVVMTETAAQPARAQRMARSP